jgi:hypothetical protein
MGTLLKRFLFIFINGFIHTVLHDVFGRLVEGLSIIIALGLGAAAQYREAIAVIVWGLAITAAYHAFKSAHTLCAEVMAQIRDHPYQVESPYIYTPSGAHAFFALEAPTAPRFYRSILYGAAGATLCVCIVAGVLTSRWSHKSFSHEQVETLPVVAPLPQEQTIKVVITYATQKPTAFWLVRNDVKQYFAADLATVMRFTNLTSSEILVDSVKFEVIGKLGEAPYRIFPLGTPDESWRLYCGLSKTLVMPCTLDKGFLFDILRQPIPVGHTVYAVALFQIPQGKDLSQSSGLNLRIIDMRGKSYEIGAIVSTDTDPGSLEQLRIQNSRPVIDISAYSEQRPFYP